MAKTPSLPFSIGSEIFALKVAPAVKALDSLRVFVFRWNWKVNHTWENSARPSRDSRKNNSEAGMREVWYMDMDVQSQC